MPHPSKHITEHLLRLISRLPMWWLYRLSDLLFPLVYHVVRYRRRVVRDNLRRSFPERSALERRIIARRYYRFLCDYAVETIKLMTISPEEMKRRMQFTGIDEADRLLDSHPFCFLMLGHFGNWEWVSTFAAWSRHYCAQIYKPLHNATFDAIFYHLRSRFGAENIAKRDVLPRIVALRRSGTPAHIGFIADQTPSGTSIHEYMEFLHQHTPVFTGAERIGRRVGAAAVFARVTRPRRGYYVCHIEPLAENIADLPEGQFTELFMRRLEREIEEHPHLWLWSHKRWKYAQPPQVDPPRQAHER